MVKHYRHWRQARNLGYMAATGGETERWGAFSTETSQPSRPSSCRARTVLGRIGDKWAIYVVDRLGDGPRRFSELHRGIEGITGRMLTVTLRGLERDGILTRTVHATVPPRVDYELTVLGRTLLDTIGQLVAWADAHIAEIEAARADYDARSCPPPCAEEAS
jgi:DNA-binding HxlR family transcriptional regulator